MKIGPYILGTVFVIFVLIAIGQLIGVNDYNNIQNTEHTDEFRALFGGVEKEYTVNPLEYNEFSNVTVISAASGEDGTFQEYKIANKAESPSISIWQQGKNVIGSFFSFSGLSLLSKLLIALISIAIIIAGIEFFRRYKL